MLEGMTMPPYPSELIAAWLVAVACIAAIALTSNVSPDAVTDRVINPSGQFAAREAQSTLDGHSIFKILTGERNGESNTDSH